MIDYIHKDLYWQDSIDKQLKIELEDGTIIDNSMIYSEEFELEESLCSDDELRFGACEASCVKFRIFAVPNKLVGQKITISEVVGGQTDNPMQIGKYKIASAKPTADRDFIDTVAYDGMYDIIHADVAAWYNNQFKATTTTTTDEDGNETTVVTYSTTTLKKFRDSFFSHFGIEQVDIALPNDGMVVSKTIEIVPNEDGTIGETLSGSTVIEAICELNGCFGHINRDGKFEYVTLQTIAKELFPADDLFPKNDLYPSSDNVGLVIYNWQYEATEYEDFDVQPITQVQIIQEDNDIGVTVGTDGNKYVVNSNFLTYSLADAELETVGTNLLSVIEKTKYTPIKASVIGNPCVTVGDIIKIVTNSAILYSYVINRTLKGCQSLTDEFESNGEEYRSVDVNSTRGQIKKLQGRSNVLERSIDETRSTITNVEKGLKSEIKQTAESITSTVAESTKQWDTVDSNGNAVSIKQSGYGFDGSISGGDSYVYSDSMVEDDIYLDQKFGYGWACKGTKVINGRRASLFGYRPRYVFKLITSNLSSEIKQTASSIESTVAESQSKWDITNFPVQNATIKSGYGVPTVSMTGYNGYLDVSTGLEYYWGDDSTGTGNKKWTVVGKATEIKSDLETKITETASEITASVTEKLKNYSTTEEMNSAISISKDSIESTVSKTQSKWKLPTNVDESNVIYGYGTAESNGLDPEENYGKAYLDVETGLLQTNDRNLDHTRYWWNSGIQCDKIENILQSGINMNANGISLEVERATTKEEDLQSSIDMHADEIVLKVDANGRIVEVALTGDPKDGTEFTVDADNISLTASDIIDIIAGNSINLTSKNITIDSTNFSVDEDGNMSCKNADINGDIKANTMKIIDKIILKYSSFVSTYNDVTFVWLVPSPTGVYATPHQAHTVFDDGLEVGGTGISSNGASINGHAQIGSLAVTGDETVANLTATGTVTAGSVSSNGACGFGSVWTGALTCAGDTVVPDWYANTTESGSNCHIGSAGRIRRVASSSKRYKDDITTDIKEELDPHKLYDTTIYQYKYKKGYLSSEKEKRKDRIGFIVEDLEKQYPIAVDYIKDEKGNEIPENWNDRYLIPPMLKLIQEQKQEIDTLKQQLATLTERMDRYEQGL